MVEASSGATVDGNGDIIVQSWPTGDIECRRTISDHRAGVTSLAQHQGLLFSGAYDGTIKVFDTGMGRLVKSVAGHQLSVWTVAIHAESSAFFSAGSDGYIKKWSMEEGNMGLLLSATDQQCKIYSLVVNGDRLYSGSSDGKIKVSFFFPRQAHVLLSLS